MESPKFITVPEGSDAMVRIKKFIDELVSDIEAEAAYDGQPELCDENYLYECFKNNIEFNRKVGNWQVLKYYSRIVVIKLAKSMLGEFTFTEHDVEMIEYFGTMNMDPEEKKCRQRKLKLKSPKAVHTDYWYIIDRIDKGQARYGGMYLAMNYWLDMGHCSSKLFFDMAFSTVSDEPWGYYIDE